MKITLGIVVILSMKCIPIVAQSNAFSNVRTFEMVYPINPIVQTQKSIVPSTIRFSINSQEIDIDYSLKNNTITIDTSSLMISDTDTLILFLRVFAINFEAPYFLIDANQRFAHEIAIPIESDFGYQRDERKELFKKGINYNGSYARGISVGNSQSLVFNSQLNLQLDGDLGNGLSIKAVISDDQIPIQPEGNTQVLQEFDKVFIQIAKDKTNLTAGDYDLKSLPFQFAKYQKKMKGIKLQHTMSDVGGAEVIAKGSFAISKGKYVREKIANKEGNQGPYKLRANNASNYIIIIAGSEKVFIDGKLIRRGESLDYVIDYNRAELFFTAKNIIDSDKRIYIEYEYRDQSYLRSMYALQTQVKKGNASFSVDFFREADSKSIVNNDDIDSLDFQVLQLAGDDVSKAVQSGVSPIENVDDTQREYYNKEFVESSIDSALVYTPTPNEKSYIAYFSNVGDGNGSYIIDPDAKANGRVYKYVGLGEGAYEPVKQLVAPQKKQMLSLGAAVLLNKNTKVSTEISISDFDNNRFSSIANQDNQGLAALLKLENTTYLDTGHTWTLTSRFQSEYVQEDFNSINPYRNVEYARDWNLRDTKDRTLELSNRASIELRHKEIYKLAYGLKSFVKKGLYNGLKHESSIGIHKLRYGIDADMSYLKADDLENETGFLRPNIDAYIILSPHWKLGTTYNHEGLVVRDINTSLLSQQSNAFDKYGVYLLTKELDKFKLQLSVNRRLDKKVKAGLLTDAYRADEVKINGQWNRSKESRLRYDVGFRKLDIIDPSLTSNLSGRHLLSNLGYQFTAWKKAIRSNTNYQIGIGQEPKLEYSFEKVQAGQGNYVWQDYNMDGKEQIDEFNTAIYQDTANYIKIPVFNNQFVSTNTMEFVQNIRLDPSLYIGTSKKRKWLKKWSSHSSIRYRQKQMIGTNNDIIPFFHFEIGDSLVFAHNGSVQNTIFYNKGNPDFDMQIGQFLITSKSTQVTGYEVQKNKKYFIRNRVNLWNTTDLINKYTFGRRNRLSEKFGSRAYDILSHLGTSTVSYRPKTTLRINVTGEYDYRINQVVDNNTVAISKKLNLNVNYKLSKKSNVITDLKYVKVDYDGEKNTPLHTVMLDGLNKGNNYIWSVFYNQEMRKNLYLSIRYNGRKTGEIKPIHSFSAQMKASF